MKLYIRASLDSLTASQYAKLKKNLMASIYRLWVNGGKGAYEPGSVYYETINDYMESDYSNLADYVFDHKEEIFDFEKLMEMIEDYANSDYKPRGLSSEVIGDAMIDIYDNLTKSDLSRTLTLRQDDPRRK